jgi:hypothetical protein
MKNDQTQTPPWEPSKEDIKLLLPELEEPRYAASMVKRLDSRITYRKLNSWERHFLISPHREPDKGGWRKFSFAEMVQLLTISDLKQVGMPTPVVRYAVGWLIGFPPGVSMFSILLVTTIRGLRNILFIGADGAVSFPQNTDGILSIIKANKTKGPVICCPFYDYVRRVLALSGTKLDFVDLKEPRPLTSREKKMLEIIADKEYEHLEIVKSDGEVTTIRALRRERGKFTVNDVVLKLQSGDFRTVTATTKDGRVVTLKTTDVYKL